jgi:hypothetical protein
VNLSGSDILGLGVWVSGMEFGIYGSFFIILGLGAWILKSNGGQDLPEQL